MDGLRTSIGNMAYHNCRCRVSIEQYTFQQVNSQKRGSLARAITFNLKDSLSRGNENIHSTKRFHAIQSRFTYRP